MWHYVMVSSSEVMKIILSYFSHKEDIQLGPYTTSRLPLADRLIRRDTVTKLSRPQ